MSEDESKARSDQTDPDSQNQIDSASPDSHIEDGNNDSDSPHDLSAVKQVISMPPTGPGIQPKLVSVEVDYRETREVITGPIPPPPIPSPKILKAYGEIDPSFPERIVAQFENESSHRRREERRDSAATVRDIHASRMERRIGQILAGGISIAILGVLLWVTIAGHTAVGVTLAGSLAIAITVFVTGQRREQEHTETEDDNS